MRFRKCSFQHATDHFFLFSAGILCLLVKDSLARVSRKKLKWPITDSKLIFLQPQEGYNYEPPENPLVISRPQDEPIETDNDNLADANEEGGSHGHGHHGGSGDPLDWLRESIPGEFTEFKTEPFSF